MVYYLPGFIINIPLYLYSADPPKIINTNSSHIAVLVTLSTPIDAESLSEHTGLYFVTYGANFDTNF